MDGANVGIIDKGVAEHREEGKFPDMAEKGGVVEEPKVYDKAFMQRTRYKVIVFPPSPPRTRRLVSCL